MNLLGRYMYLDTCLDVLDDDISPVDKTIPISTEKAYLLLSSYLITTGWKVIVASVREAVVDAIDITPLSHLTTSEWLAYIIKNIRKHVEQNVNLVSLLMEKENNKARITVGQKSAMETLVGETRDLIESRDARGVIASCLDDAFSVLEKSIQPIYYPLDGKVIDDQLNEGSGSQIVEVQEGKQIVLAGILPKISRFAHQVIAGPPNVYVDVSFQMNLNQ